MEFQVLDDSVCLFAPPCGRVIWVCSDRCGEGVQLIIKSRRHRRIYNTAHFVSNCKLPQRKNTSCEHEDLLIKIDEKHQRINIQISHEPFFFFLNPAAHRKRRCQMFGQTKVLRRLTSMSALIEVWKCCRNSPV